MTDELRRTLESAAQRGSPAGAEAVVDRAMTSAAGRKPIGHRVATAAVAAALVVVLAAGGLYAYARNRLGDVERVKVGTAVSPGAPMNVLVVGADGERRADVVIVVRVEPATGRVAMLSLPRDLWVRDVRLGAVLERGPQALVQAVTESTGIEVNHYAQLDFDGFRRIVEAVRGVNVPFPAPARDVASGLAVSDPGCVRLDGREALAYVRSRHFEVFEDGRWTADPTGDLGRIVRQHVFLRQFGAALTALGRNPVELHRVLDAAADHATLDARLTTNGLRDLANRLAGIEPGSIESWTLPTQPATVGGAAVLRLIEPDAGEVAERFVTNGPAAPAQSPKTAPEACV